jgi:hypothetical protein
MTMPGAAVAGDTAAPSMPRSPLFKPGASPGPPLSRGGDEKEKTGNHLLGSHHECADLEFRYIDRKVSRHPGGGAGIHPGHRYRPPPVGCG